MKINIYPIKSARRAEVKEASFDRLGLENDRRWAVVDLSLKAKAIRTQRNEGFEKLALITPSVTQDHLTLNAPGMPELTIPKNTNIDEAFQVRLFSQKPLVVDQGKEAREWLSDFFGSEVQLVYQPPKLATSGVALVDNKRVLVISYGSLADLNHLLNQKGILDYPMESFRTNFEASAITPYEENTWQKITTGEVVLESKGPCSRCQIPDIDQNTGKYFDPTKETKIVDILREYRGKPTFGQYFDNTNTGRVCIGDEIKL